MVSIAINSTPLGVEREGRSEAAGETVRRTEKAALTREVTDGLRRLADTETLIHGAWAILLSRYSGESEVVFGSRDVSGAMLALKVVVDPGARVEEWLKRLKSGETALTRFETSVAFAEVTEPNGALVVVALPHEQLTLQLIYSSERFSDDVVQRTLGHLKTLLESMAANPEQRLSQLRLLTTAELEQLTEWNNITHKYPQHVLMHELFETQAQLTPDATAVVFHKSRITYEELDRRANQLAHYLRRLGVGPEVQVGVLLERSIEMIVSMLAVLKAGGAYVPLDPQYPEERLAFMIDDTGARVVIVQEHLRRRLHDRAVDLVVIEEQGRSDEPIEKPAVRIDEENLAYLIYTSGSTGVPKGVAIMHRNAAALIHWALDTFDPEDLAGVLASTSFCFDISMFELFVPLSMGGQVILAEHLLASAILEAKAEVRLINTGPSIVSELLRMQGLPPNTRVVNLAGEALRRPLVEQLYKQPPVEQVVNLYGPSEDTTYSTWAVIESEDEGPVVIGRPLTNSYAYVVDSSGSVLPMGVAGELWLGGAGLSRGYLNRPDVTADRFIPDALSGRSGARLYRTGDLCRYRDDGNIEFLGRIDHQVKIRGIRIELGEVETVLTSHAAVQEAVVVLKGTRLVAYLVSSRNDLDQLSRDLQRYMRKKVPAIMVPSLFVTLSSLPHTPNGKVDRKALPEPEFKECKVDYVAPRTPVEETLAALWSEVLGKNQVGVHDDFFDLGGDSLLATMINARVRQLLQVDLPQQLFFDSATIAELAEHVDEIKRSHEERVNTVNEPEKTLNELSPSQRAALVMRLKKKAVDDTTEHAIPRRRDAGPVALSFAQQRLWFLEQMGDSNYIVPATSRLTGPLNVEALERSLNVIVERHEVLRTTFTTIDNQPVQVIAPRVPLTLLTLDLSHLPESERDVEVRRMREEALRPFNLERGPLIRARLLRLAEEEHLLLLAMHHIVSDGWSLGVVIRELAALYESFVEGTTPNLPELPIQYADFGVWQRQWLSGDVLEGQLQYWREQLGNHPPVLELPTDRPRPSVPTYKGSFVTCEIGKDLTEALKDLSRREGVSLYMTLLAAFKTQLARYAGQDQVIVGTPIANRNRVDIENLIGFFVNTLVLRSDLSGNPRFHQFLKQIREVTLGAFAHQDVPFEKLVEELQPERDMSRTPLFQVMFSLQNSPLPPLKLSQVTMTLLQDDSTTSQFDLTLDITERGEGMDCLLEYSTEVFDHSTALRILNHFTNLLESIVVSPHQRVRELPLLTNAEREQILVEWNRTAGSHERCIHELFEEQAEQRPDSPALIFGGERVTYAELNQRANQLARYLKELGVGPESRVGILLERSVEMAVALLGILKAGGGYVAFDPSYPAERLRYMLEDSGVTLLLTQQNLMTSDFRVRPIFLNAERDAIAKRDTQNVQSGTDPSNIVYLVYTSGSTGRPKGIVIEHRSLVNAAYGFINNHRMTERDRLLQFASLSFDVAAEEFFSAWLSGSCIVMRPDTVMSYAEFTSLLQQEEITIVNLPASFWLEWLTAINDQGLEIPSSLRRVIVGNEKTLEETLAKWQRTVGQQVEWCNAYGPSETTITVSNYEPATTSSAREEKSVVPIGRPSLNAELYVLDPAQQLVPTGVAGELYIGGAGLARGYHNQPAQTAERFIPHPYSQNAGQRLYRTGDLARYRADGNIEFLGRVDEQVKIRGFRIELGEVEAVLAQHAGVRESVVVAREDDRGSARLVAYVVANNGDLQTADLRNHMTRRLSEYMVPSSFVVMEALPRTPNGKVDRRALPKDDGARAEAEEVYIAPRSGMERTIANIWQELLKVEKVGVNDNFFGLGGHSLLLVNAQSKVTEALRVKVSMVEMFKYPTISALAEYLSQQGSAMAAAAAPARNQAESRIDALNRQRQLRQKTRPQRST